MPDLEQQIIAQIQEKAFNNHLIESLREYLSTHGYHGTTVNFDGSDLSIWRSSSILNYQWININISTNQIGWVIRHTSIRRASHRLNDITIPYEAPMEKLLDAINTILDGIEKA